MYSAAIDLLGLQDISTYIKKLQLIKSLHTTI